MMKHVNIDKKNEFNELNYLHILPHRFYQMVSLTHIQFKNIIDEIMENVNKNSMYLNI